jgi:hypothetical protein
MKEEVMVYARSNISRQCPSEYKEVFMRETSERITFLSQNACQYKQPSQTSADENHK